MPRGDARTAPYYRAPRPIILRRSASAPRDRLVGRGLLMRKNTMTKGTWCSTPIYTPADLASDRRVPQCERRLGYLEVGR